MSESATELKFCKDCKHLGGLNGFMMELCIHPSVQSRNLVSGKLGGRECMFMRAEWGSCGESGQLFEKRDK